MIEEKLNVGIVGCGLLGSAHADVLSKSETFRVTALADVRTGNVVEMEPERAWT